MIGYLRTRVRKQPIIALYFEAEDELKFYNIEACICLVTLSALWLFFAVPCVDLQCAIAVVTGHTQ